MEKKVKVSMTITPATLFKVTQLEKLLVKDVILVFGEVIDIVVGEKYTAMGGPEVPDDLKIKLPSWVKSDLKEKQKEKDKEVEL